MFSIIINRMLLIIDSVLFIIGLIGIIIAIISDVKTTEVPDYSNYFLIFSGISLRVLYSIISSDWSFTLTAIKIFPFIFVLSLIMYYTKQWGGGDAKLLMGLSLIFATYPSFLKNIFNPDLVIDFPFVLFLNILVIGIFYSLIYASVLTVKNYKKTFPSIKTGLKNNLKFEILSLVISLILIIIFLIADDSFISLLSLLLAVIFPVLLFLYVFIKSIEKSLFIKNIPVSKLREGDWIISKIIVRGKIIHSPFQELTKEKILQIKKAKIKEVIIKEGIVFTPVFLIAFLISLILGNLFFIL